MTSGIYPVHGCLWHTVEYDHGIRCGHSIANCSYFYFPAEAYRRGLAGGAVKRLKTKQETNRMKGIVYREGKTRLVWKYDDEML